MDWYDEFDRPPRRGTRRYRRLDREATVEELEDRLEALRNEVRRVETELMGIRGEEAAEGP